MPPARQPWPMKWIVLAIVAFIGLYTYVNLHFRKLGPAYQPYRDSQQRASLAQAGYQRVTLRADLPADPKPLTPLAAVSPAAPGLPADLGSTLIVPPLLPTVIGAVSAAAVSEPIDAYRIAFACTRGDAHQEVAGAALYLKGHDLFIVTDCERLAEGLTARSRTGVVVLSVPTTALPIGTYRVTLCGSVASKAWTLQVH
jgi:hypothetical protein